MALKYWRIFLEIKLEDMLNFIEKKTFFFNYGLCCPFSEKRYICFLVNILAVLLILFIPNLVRKCQIMCSRIWVEEIVFLKFFGTVSKENMFLSRMIFLNSYQSIFYADVIFANKNFLRGFEHEICFLEDFLLLALPWQQGPAFEHIQHFFMVLWISDLYLYTDKYSRLHCFICPKYTVLRKGVLLWNPHM